MEGEKTPQTFDAIIYHSKLCFLRYLIVPNHFVSVWMYFVAVDKRCPDVHTCIAALQHSFHSSRVFLKKIFRFFFIFCLKSFDCCNHRSIFKSKLQNRQFLAFSCACLLCVKFHLNFFFNFLSMCFWIRSII